ncbi:hypothetical protein [Zymobacter sp. IVIA_12111.31 C1]|uniref:hypothetical protein n=1 Tax=Zymobacter sp. IVIA_12111.31 C1 TaxID=3394854 RepID=UPI0039C25633
MSFEYQRVNFSENHELNYLLRRIGKRQTQRNRDTVVTLGKSLKKALKVRTLTHQQFIPFLRGKRALLK